MAQTEIVWNEGVQPGDRTYVFPVNLGSATVEMLPAGSAPAVTVAGTSTDVRFAFELPKGDPTPNALEVGTVTKGAPDSNPAASITGAWPNQVLNLTIPQGAKGDKGDAGVLSAESQAAVDQAVAAAQTSATTATNAKTAAETARTGAEAARTAAQQAKTDAETARTGAEAAQTAVNTARNAEPRVYLAADFGADPTGVTPADSAWSAAMAALAAKGGGTLILDGEAFRFNQRLDYPTTAVDAVGNAGYPIRVRGRGARTASTNGLDRYQKGGTRLLLNFNSWAMITMTGFGRQSLEDVTLVQVFSATSTEPFIFVRHASAEIKNVEIVGHSSRSGTACTQVGIRLGDTTQPFGGYGTLVQNVTFNRVKQCIIFGQACNSTRVENVVVSELCGADDDSPAFLFDGQSGECRGNTIDGAVVESYNYAYLCKFQNNATHNVITSFGAWDQPAAPGKFQKCFLLGQGCFGNTFIGIHGTFYELANLLANPHGVDFFMQTGSYMGVSTIETGGSQDLRVITSDARTLAVSGGGIRPPWKSTRPVFASGMHEGAIIYNGAAKKLEFWDGAKWQTVTSTP